MHHTIGELIDHQKKDTDAAQNSSFGINEQSTASTDRLCMNVWDKQNCDAIRTTHSRIFWDEKECWVNDVALHQGKKSKLVLQREPQYTLLHAHMERTLVMDSKLALRLDSRIRHLATDDVEKIVDRLFGGGAYLHLIRELDAELVKAAAVIRKGTTDTAAQDIADKRLRLAAEMQEARRYRKTKLGKLESQYLPMVHHLRTANGDGLSWPAIVRLLKIKYRFTVSVPYLCRVYDGWLQRVQAE